MLISALRKSTETQCRSVASNADFVGRFASIDPKDEIVASPDTSLNAAVRAPPSAPAGHPKMEDIMDACFVRSTATWLAAIFVSCMFVTAATSTIGII